VRQREECASLRGSGERKNRGELYGEALGYNGKPHPYSNQSLVSPRGKELLMKREVSEKEMDFRPKEITSAGLDGGGSGRRIEEGIGLVNEAKDGRSGR